MPSLRAPARGTLNMRFLAILTLRNEGAFLLEWLAHHRSVGFTDFLVFSNDCQDGTDEMLDRLATMGGLTHVRNDGPYDQRGIQFTALKQADRLEPVRSADWILTCDIDEFVNIHVGDRSLHALVGALPRATAIALGWRLFGNAGVRAYADTPVTETFLQAAPEVLHWPWRAAMFKTLYRNDGTYRKPGVHRPRAPRPERLDAARWFDSHGRPLSARYRTEGLFLPFGRPNYGLAQINHYALGAMESFLLKADRGRVNRSHAPIAMDYWVERNFNQVEDRSILGLAPQTRAEQHRLMADPVLARLHRAAVDWRHQRIRALMREEEPRSLFARLMMTPPSRALPEDEAQILIQAALAARDAAGG